MLTIPRRIAVIIADPIDPALLTPGCAVYVQRIGVPGYHHIGSIAPADPPPLSDYRIVSSSGEPIGERVGDLHRSSPRPPCEPGADASGLATLAGRIAITEEAILRAGPPPVSGSEREAQQIADELAAQMRRAWPERPVAVAPPEPSAPVSPPSPIESHTGIRGRELTRAEFRSRQG